MNKKYYESLDFFCKLEGQCKPGLMKEYHMQSATKRARKSPSLLVSALKLIGK